MKKLFILIVLAALSVAAADECFAQFSNISIGKYSIESIRPEGFSSVKGSVMLEVTNAGEGFTVSDVSGTVYKEGVPFVTGQASGFRVAPGSQKLVISGRAGLCQGASLWTVLGLLFFDPEDYAVDIRLKVTTDSGAVRVIEKKRLPVTVLLKIR
jgi:hypothetical protein